MSAREPRFEIVRSHAGWFARFVAANGRKVWQTEVYHRRRDATRAINSIVAPTYGWVEGGAVVCLASRNSWEKTNHSVAEIREVDERTFPPLGDAL